MTREFGGEMGRRACHYLVWDHLRFKDLTDKDWPFPQAWGDPWDAVSLILFLDVLSIKTHMVKK